jgi:heat-inducible transcriptional repressor
MDLNERQKKLLNAIVDQFIETAEAVGSLSLLENYEDFKLSSATVRNEMMKLVNEGFLFKKHDSSGRIPTTKGWRYYVGHIENQSLKEPDIRTKEEVKLTLNKVRDEIDNLIRYSIGFLSHMSHNASVALINDKVFYSGLSELVDIPEFKQSDLLKRVLGILEDYYTLSKMFNTTVADDDINVLIGEETGLENFSDCAIVFSEIRLNGNKKGYIAVIGPNRMKYRNVIPAVKYITDTVRELLKS